VIDLDEAAATHLTGFRFSKTGTYDSTRESADGIHPTRTRHRELGTMVYERIVQLLAHEEGSGERVPVAVPPAERDERDDNDVGDTFPIAPPGVSPQS
jgi:hypothetical protein